MLKRWREIMRRLTQKGETDRPEDITDLKRDYEQARRSAIADAQSNGHLEELMASVLAERIPRDRRS